MKNTYRFGTCSKDCYGSCVFRGEWDDDALEKKFRMAKPLKDHPLTKGFFCTKFNHRERLLYHPNRLKSALLRSDPKGINSFKPVSIDKLYDNNSDYCLELQ